MIFKTWKLLFFFILLSAVELCAAELSSAAPTCFAFFSNGDQKSYIEHQLSQKLQPYLDQIPNKISESILAKINHRITDGNISKLDFYKLSLKYYKSLQGSYFQSYINQFSRKKVNDNLELTEQFHHELEQTVIKELNIVPKESLWIKTRLKLIEYHLPLSVIKSLALNAAVQWGFYNATGNFIPLPVDIPRFTSFNFKTKLSGFQKASLFYEGLFKSLVRTYYAISLAYTAVNPENINWFFESLLSLQDQTSHAQQAYNEAANKLNNYDDLAAEIAQQSIEVAAFVKKHSSH